jgi:hypothetical protein
MEIFTKRQLECLDSELEIVALNYFKHNSQKKVEKELDEVGDQHLKVFGQVRHREIRDRFKALYLHGEKK